LLVPFTVVSVLGVLALVAVLSSNKGVPRPPAGPEKGIVNSIGMQLTLISPGAFQMGSPDNEVGHMTHERPRHEVIITKPFYMGVHEVTVGEFKAFVKETGYQTEAEKGGGALRRFPDGSWRQDAATNWKTPGFAQTDTHPVVCVSWNDAVAFCAWLSKKEAKAYGLPTEAQWEYACRAGSPTPFCFGEGVRELGQYAWYDGNSGSRTHPVGEKKANAWGLFDMHGNAWEWTADCYGKDYYATGPREDPPGPRVGDVRVLRGGGWGYGATLCRSALRDGVFVTSSRSTMVGFRVVLLP
jgi:formylglycine-generating enzyme required for sulfatase activity